MDEVLEADREGVADLDGRGWGDCRGAGSLAVGGHVDAGGAVDGGCEGVAGLAAGEHESFGLVVADGEVVVVEAGGERPVGVAEVELVELDLEVALEVLLDVGLDRHVPAFVAFDVEAALGKRSRPLRAGTSPWSLWSAAPWPAAFGRRC